MKTKNIIVVSTLVLVILLVVMISYFTLMHKNRGLVSKEDNLQIDDDSSICMIDTECDEDIIQSEITANAVKVDNSNNSVVLYFFWGEGCPHCAEQKPFLDSLKQKYPLLEVKMFETWYNKENAERFQQMAESFGTSAQGVPTTFIGDKYWVGFADYMKPEIEDYIEYCLDNGCPSHKVN